MSQTKTQGRQMMLIVLFVFLVPLIGAILLFITRSHWHFNSTNYGQLIKAMPTETVLHLQHPDNTASFTAKENKWKLVLVTESCGENCFLNLEKINSIWEATGRDKDSVQQALVLTRPAPDTQINLLKTQFNSLSDIAFTDSNHLTDNLPITKQDIESGFVYLTDPESRIILKYKQSADTSGILRDLRHLLKLARG